MLIYDSACNHDNNEHLLGATALSGLGGPHNLPVYLDDVGCNGFEKTLLNCLPEHNCQNAILENAGVKCQKGAHQR